MARAKPFEFVFLFSLFGIGSIPLFGIGFIFVFAHVRQELRNQAQAELERWAQQWLPSVRSFYLHKPATGAAGLAESRLRALDAEFLAALRAEVQVRLAKIREFADTVKQGGNEWAAEEKRLREAVLACAATGRSLQQLQSARIASAVPS